MSFKWLPNALTISRGLAGFAVAYAIVRMTLAEGLSVWSWLPFVFFCLAALTDYFDGIAARKLDAVSALGARLDPIADKVLVAASLIALVWSEHGYWVLLVPTIAIVGRDALITGLREVLGNPPGLAVMNLAKWKTAAELVAIGTILAALAIGAWEPASGPSQPFGWLSGIPALVGVVVLWIAAFLSVVTGWTYLEAMMKDQRSKH